MGVQKVSEHSRRHGSSGNLDPRIKEADISTRSEEMLPFAALHHSTSCLGVSRTPFLYLNPPRPQPPSPAHPSLAISPSDPISNVTSSGRPAQTSPPGAGSWDPPPCLHPPSCPPPVIRHKNVIR